MLGTMYRWCVAALSSGLWNIPTPVDQVLDGCVIQTHVKIDALCEQRWPPEQHPGKKSGHVTPAVTKDHWEPSACSGTQITYTFSQATTYISSPATSAQLPALFPTSVVRLRDKSFGAAILAQNGLRDLSKSKACRDF